MKLRLLPMWVALALPLALGGCGVNTIPTKEEVAKAKWASLGLGQETLSALLQEKKAGVIAALPTYAPLGGTIVHADLSMGKVVEPSEHLFEVIELSKIWIKIGVLERDLSKIEAGQPIELRMAAYPDEVVAVRSGEYLGSFLDLTDTENRQLRLIDDRRAE